MTIDQDPDGVSEAIESELRRKEAERSRVARSLRRRVLRGIAGFALFLVRLESLTAYATLAAAFAAFLALKAADRQEKATFTSALYAKQVDVLATLNAKSARLNELLDITYEELQDVKE
jgi:hypothetical protein